MHADVSVQVRINQAVASVIIEEIKHVCCQSNRDQGEHADDLSNMLETFDPEKAPALIGESYRM
jgi:hypothetical protein